LDSLTKYNNNNNNNYNNNNNNNYYYYYYYYIIRKRPGLQQAFCVREPAKDWDRFNVDWFPKLCLGHSKQQLKNPETAEVWSRKAPERQKRRSELLEKQRKEKMPKIDEPGETIEEIPLSESLCWVKT